MKFYTLIPKDTRKSMSMCMIIQQDMLTISEIAWNCWTSLFYSTCFFNGPNVHWPNFQPQLQESPTARATSEVPKESELESPEAPKTRTKKSVFFGSSGDPIFLQLKNNGPIVVQSLWIISLWTPRLLGVCVFLLLRGVWCLKGLLVLGRLTYDNSLGNL